MLEWLPPGGQGTGFFNPFISQPSAVDCPGGEWSPLGGAAPKTGTAENAGQGTWVGERTHCLSQGIRHLRDPFPCTPASSLVLLWASVPILHSTFQTHANASLWKSSWIHATPAPGKSGLSLQPAGEGGCSEEGHLLLNPPTGFPFPWQERVPQPHLGDVVPSNCSRDSAASWKAQRTCWVATLLLRTPAPSPSLSLPAQG